MKLDSNAVLRVSAGLSLSFAGLSPAFAGTVTLATFPTPALDEFGLIGLGVMIGVVGLITLLRRKK
jgi:hypothetical protein